MIIGFTHHVEIADFMTGLELHERVVEAIEEMFTEIPVSISFDYSGGCDAIMYPTDKAQPREEPEIEFQEDSEVLAYQVLAQIAGMTPIEILIMHGDEFLMLKDALAKEFDSHKENLWLEKALCLVDEKAEADLCAEADHKNELARDRRL